MRRGLMRRAGAVLECATERKGKGCEDKRAGTCVLRAKGRTPGTTSVCEGRLIYSPAPPHARMLTTRVS